MSESLRPYPAYRDSGVAWLGDVPAHWGLIRTKTLLRERSQKGFPDEPLLAATQTKGVVRKEQYENRTVLALKDLHLLKLVRVGDFVISLRSFQGGIEYAREQGIISPAYTILSPVDRQNYGYLALLFKSKPFIEDLTLFVTGIREGQNIDYEKLSRSPLPLPPLPEQSAIVRFLDHADRRLRRAIRAKRQLIALLNEQKQAIIHRAVTRGLDEKIPLRFSGVDFLGDVPTPWKIVRCRFLFSETNETNNPNGQLLSIDRYKGIIPQSETGRKSRASEDRSKYKRIKPGQLAYNLMNAFMGSIGMSSYDGIVSPAYAVARPLQKIEPRYYHFLFRTKIYTEEYNRLSYGIMYERNRMYFDCFQQVRALVPPIAEQKEIVEWIDRETLAIDTVITCNRREIDLLLEFRTRLIADVVTGKLDVREAAAGLPDEANEPALFDEFEVPEDEENESTVDIDGEKEGAVV